MVVLIIVFLSCTVRSVAQPDSSVYGYCRRDATRSPYLTKQLTSLADTVAWISLSYHGRWVTRGWGFAPAFGRSLR
jgi:hypothetical protein